MNIGVILGTADSYLSPLLRVTRQVRNFTIALCISGTTMRTARNMSLAAFLDSEARGFRGENVRRVCDSTNPQFTKRELFILLYCIA